jgi:hypothetical protein
MVSGSVYIGRVRTIIFEHSALFFTASAIFIFFLTMLARSAKTSLSGESWPIEVIRQYEWVSSSDQRAAHAFTLVAVALFGGLSFQLARRGAAESWPKPPVPPLSLNRCIILSVIGFLFYFFNLPFHFTESAAALAVAFFTFAVVGPRLKPRLINQAILLLIAIYVACLALPGFLTRPIPFSVSDPTSLAQLEMHLDVCTMPSRAIASGQLTFDQFHGYGLLMISIMSVIDHWTNSLTIGHQLRFVQICQLLFILTATAAYLRYKPNAYFGVLVAISLAGPYWATAGLGIWHQNQTGLRSLGLPLSMLALTLSRNASLPRAAWWLGSVAAIDLLIDFETAVALSLGFVVYVIARTRRFPVDLFIRMAGGGLLTIVAYLIVYRFSLGRLPFGEQGVNLTYYIGRFTQGDFGLRLFSAGQERENYFIVPFAFLMFLHAIYVTIQAATRLGSAPLSHHSSMQWAVATTLLAWSAYYFNAPNWWQIWSLLFLYGFLIIDLLDRRKFGFGSHAWHYDQLAVRLRHMQIAPGVFAALFLLFFMIANTSGHLVRFTREFRTPDWLRNRQDASLLSGVLMPDDLAVPLQAKADALKKLYASVGGKLVYLTFNVAFIPALTGIVEPEPYRDLWIYVPGEAAFDPIMRRLLDNRPEIILIDAPAGPLAVVGPRQDYLNRIRQAVGRGYLYSGAEDGWQVWRPQL